MEKEKKKSVDQFISYIQREKKDSGTHIHQHVLLLSHVSILRPPFSLPLKTITVHGADGH